MLPNSFDRQGQMKESRQFYAAHFVVSIVRSLTILPWGRVKCRFGRASRRLYTLFYHPLVNAAQHFYFGLHDRSTIIEVPFL